MREELTLIPAPTLHRLMELRDALVALKGPLAQDRALCERLHKRLFIEDLERLDVRTSPSLERTSCN